MHIQQRQFQCEPTTYVTENKENYLEIYTYQVECSLSLCQLPISINILATLREIVYILNASKNATFIILPTLDLKLI